MSRVGADRIGNIAALVAVIVVNFMSNAVPLGGQTTSEISANYPALFTPAGFTFGIWGLIYLSLGVFVVYQALPSQQDNHTVARISLWFKLSCFFNAAWIFAWHYEFLIVSLIFMLGILWSLIKIFRVVDLESGFVLRFPFSLYTGWVTVATIANLSAVQLAYGFDEAGLTAIQWTWLKLALAGAVGAIVISRTSNAIYVAVIAWSAFGIFSKQSATPEVAGAAITVSLLSLLLVANAIVLDRSRR